jgi:uncharacterized protein involved in cysteine biosynthesis
MQLLLPFKIMRSFLTMLNDRQALRFLIKPYLFGAGIFVISAIGLWFWIAQNPITWLSEFQTSSWLVVRTLGIVIEVLFVVLCSSLITLIITLVLAGFFLESFARHLLQRHGFLPPETESKSLLSQSTATLLFFLGEAKKITVLIILFSLIFILSFFPPLALLVFLLTAYLTGYDLADFPLAAGEIEHPKRRALLIKHRVELLLMGCTYLATALVPFGTVIFLPAFYYHTVTELLPKWRLSSEHPVL